MKTIQIVPTEKGKDPNADADGKSWWIGPDGKKYEMLNPKYYDAKGTAVAATAMEADERYLCTFDLKATGAVIKKKQLQL